jgi:hypothetical protein
MHITKGNVKSIAWLISRVTNKLSFKNDRKLWSNAWKRIFTENFNNSLQFTGHTWIVHGPRSEWQEVVFLD